MVVAVFIIYFIIYYLSAVRQSFCLCKSEVVRYAHSKVWTFSLSEVKFAPIGRTYAVYRKKTSTVLTALTTFSYRHFFIFGNTRQTVTARTAATAIPAGTM